MVVKAIDLLECLESFKEMVLKSDLVDFDDAEDLLSQCAYTLKYVDEADLERYMARCRLVIDYVDLIGAGEMEKAKVLDMKNYPPFAVLDMKNAFQQLEETLNRYWARVSAPN